MVFEASTLKRTENYCLLPAENKVGEKKVISGKGGSITSGAELGNHISNEDVSLAIFLAGESIVRLERNEKRAIKLNKTLFPNISTVMGCFWLTICLSMPRISYIES